MKYKDCETFRDRVEYYEYLLGFLGNHAPCLNELITLFEEQEGD